MTHCWFCYVFEAPFNVFSGSQKKKVVDFGLDYRGPGALIGVQRSPPLAFERAGPAVRPAYQNSSGIRRCVF